MAKALTERIEGRVLDLMGEHGDLTLGDAERIVWFDLLASSLADAAVYGDMAIGCLPGGVDCLADVDSDVWVGAYARRAAKAGRDAFKLMSMIGGL